MIIGIIGRIGAGKDTVAQIIQELQPEHNWQIKKFAGKLKQVASILTGIPVGDFEEQEVKEMHLGDEWGFLNSWAEFSESAPRVKMTVRNFLQKLGTDAIRDKLHPNAWVNALMSDYVKCVPSKLMKDPSFQIKPRRMGMTNNTLDACFDFPNWLITDVRFPNEVEAITSRGGTVIRVDRMNNPYPKSNHISETALDHLRLPTIINHGTIDNLREVVKHALKMIQNESN